MEFSGGRGQAAQRAAPERAAGRHATRTSGRCWRRRSRRRAPATSSRGASGSFARRMSRELLAGAVHQRWAARAPVVIVVCRDPRPCQARYGDRGVDLYSIQDTAAAVQNILLAAVDRGLSSCWVGAFDPKAVAGALGITPPVEPVAILPVGYSAESAGRPARRPLGGGRELAVSPDPATRARCGDDDLARRARSRSCARSWATATGARSATPARTSSSAWATRTHGSCSSARRRARTRT